MSPFIPPLPAHDIPPDTAAVLFVKPPAAGRVKTRLASAIGAEQACTLYRYLAEATIQQVVLSSLPLLLFFDGAAEETLPADWRSCANACHPQQGNNLGSRMAMAFEQVFSQGYQQVLLIGSDIPGLDAAYLKQATALLQRHDVVIGPAVDGGYCLIGCHHNRFTPRLFQDIAWSTAQVLTSTCQTCAAAGLDYHLLPMLRDIDTIEDLKALQPYFMQYHPDAPWYLPQEQAHE